MALHKSFRAAWPLFLALALVMAGNGLYSTIAGIRVSKAGFGSIAGGAVMSLLFAGYIAGCVLAPRVIRQIGHIRTFMAMAVIAAASILMQDVWSGLYGWGACRFVTGFCYVTIFIATESWLNRTTDNRIRGRMMGGYLFIVYAAMAAGQYLIDFHPAGAPLKFSIAALLTALAPLPLIASRAPAPATAPSAERMNLLHLCRLSPLGVYGVFAAGVGAGTLLILISAYADGAGMDASTIARFMAAFILGGVAGQIPLGYISDRAGRTQMIAAVALTGAAALLWCWQAADLPITVFYAALFCAGMFSLNLYGQCAAYTNDRLIVGQFVDAGAAQLLINGIGAFTGPFIVSLAMAQHGNGAFFPVLSVLYITTGLFAVYELLRRRLTAPVSPD